MRVRQRGSIRAPRATKARRDDGALRRGYGVLRYVDGVLLERTCVGVRERELRVTGQRHDRADRAPRHRAGAVDPAADVAGEIKLALRQRTVEALAGRRGSVTEPGIACPEIDTRCARLVGIDLAWG